MSALAPKFRWKGAPSGHQDPSPQRWQLLSLPLAEHNLLLIRSEATTQGGARAPLSSPPLAPEEGAQGVAGEAKGMALRDAVATRPMMRTARGKDTGFTDPKHA